MREIWPTLMAQKPSGNAERLSTSHGRWRMEIARGKRMREVMDHVFRGGEVMS